MIRRLPALLVLSIFGTGCEAPEPPQPDVPPELTPELAKQALVEMIRAGRNYPGPHKNAEGLAAEPIRVLDGGQVHIGTFWMEPDKRTWHITFRMGCMYEIEGVFVLDGRAWTAKQTGERIAYVKD